MKANELRIGNWISHELGTCQVRGTTKNGIWLNDMGGPILLDGFMNIQPIPLTDEWFIKWGFYKDDEYWSRGINDYKFCFKYRDWAKNWAFYQEFTDSPWEHDEGVKYPISFDIEFVHQIQNLWFALLHKEIEEENY